MALPSLPDDVIAEVLLRLPHDNLSSLLRATLVCKPWLRIASDPHFLRRRRRLRGLHPAPAMLGFFRGPLAPCFTATTAAAFSMPAAVPGRPNRAILDCRHGRALFVDLVPPFHLLVREPMTGERRHVPMPAAFSSGLTDLPDAAVVCATNGCDRCDCHGGPFFAALVLLGDPGATVFVYSSEAGAWREVTLELGAGAIPYRAIDYHASSVKPRILVGRTLYIQFEMGYILKYNLDGHELAVIKIPSELLTACNGNIMLMPAEDSGLGLAAIKDSRLSLWSMQEGDDAGWSWEGWSWRKTIHLDHLLSAAQNIELVGFAEGVNMVFLGADDGVFTIELKSEQVRRVCERRGCSGSIKFKTFLPLVSF